MIARRIVEQLQAGMVPVLTRGASLKLEEEFPSADAFRLWLATVATHHVLPVAFTVDGGALLSYSRGEWFEPPVWRRLGLIEAHLHAEPVRS